ncbi:MAG TPA: TetR family transcriptional regulator [Candidatus Dormibacteraeota bacterium]
MRVSNDTQDVSRPALGLREIKKRRTRQALIEAAMRLYREKGFDGVTVAEIAHEAEVSPRTFFGYFETKEDVFLGRGDDRLDRLVRAIHERDRRQPILSAIQPVLLQAPKPMKRERPARAPELPELLHHPAIAHRLRERWNRWEDMLAEAIADEVGARTTDPEPRVIAAAITGAIRIAAEAARQQPHRRKQVAERVFALLASGLTTYGA